MIRDSLNANAANAFIGLTTSNGVVWQSRSSDGGGTTSNSVTGLSAPCWVQLVESGNSVTGYYSPDGINWTQLGTTTISMGSAAYTGLAFCNNGNTALGTTTFDHVGTPGWPIPPPSVPTGLAATAGIEQATLSWQPVNYATTFIVGRATVSGGPYTNCRHRESRDGLFVDTDPPGRRGTNYYYVVSATNSAGRSANTAHGQRDGDDQHHVAVAGAGHRNGRLTGEAGRQRKLYQRRGLHPVPRPALTSGGRRRRVPLCVCAHQQHEFHHRRSGLTPCKTLRSLVQGRRDDSRQPELKRGQRLYCHVRQATASPGNTAPPTAALPPIPPPPA